MMIFPLKKWLMTKIFFLTIFITNFTFATNPEYSVKSDYFSFKDVSEYRERLTPEFENASYIYLADCTIEQKLSALNDNSYKLHLQNKHTYFCETYNRLWSILFSRKSWLKRLFICKIIRSQSIIACGIRVSGKTP